jgi:hypothetical protein
LSSASFQIIIYFYTYMAFAYSNSSSFPPKRGQIKAQIFESLAKTVVSRASKLGKAVGRIIGEGGSGSGSGGSASSTPPLSAYNSDGNSDVS